LHFCNTPAADGIAKGAMLLHRNLVANVLQSQVWLKPAHRGVCQPTSNWLTVVALRFTIFFALTVVRAQADCCAPGAWAF